MKIRATGILIEEGRILLLNQDVNEQRSWSLPGGTLEESEMLEACLIREMKEETGLDVQIGKLLYVCDLIKANLHVVHITFLVQKIGGTLGDIAEGLDTQKIRSAEMVPIKNLVDHGFSPKFQDIVEKNFPGSGNYMGAKANIGL